MKMPPTLVCCIDCTHVSPEVSGTNSPHPRKGGTETVSVYSQMETMMRQELR